MGFADEPPEGLIFHSAGELEGRFQVFNVWETRENFERFTQDRLRPAQVAVLGEERVAAAVVLATTRADVNNAVKRLLDVRKASFLSTDRATEESAMEYGGITPVGLPPAWRVLVDSRVVAADPADGGATDPSGGVVIIGSGLRRSKIALPGSLLAGLPGAEVVEDLAID